MHTSTMTIFVNYTLKLYEFVQRSEVLILYEPPLLNCYNNVSNYDEFIIWSMCQKPYQKQITNIFQIGILSIVGFNVLLQWKDCDIFALQL